MREDEIKAILRKLNASSGEIQASALVSLDGLIIASALAPDMDDARVSAMVAAVISLGDRTSAELARGTLEQLLITGKEGYVLVQHVGQAAAMCTISTRSITLGLLFMNGNHYAQAMSALLQ